MSCITLFLPACCFQSSVASIHGKCRVCFFGLKQEPFNEIEMQKMEEARMEYISAVAAAKKNPSEESLAGAAEARLKLQAFVFGTQ